MLARLCRAPPKGRIHPAASGQFILGGGMGKTKYNISYYKTKEWKHKRKLMLMWYPQCQHCRSKNSLHVHHKHYWTFEDEMPWDLIVVCKKCHEKLHFINMPDGDLEVKI